MEKLNRLSIGYIPYSSQCNSAGDRRRFIFFAKKYNLDFEVFNFQNNYDLVISSPQVNPKLLLNLPTQTKVIFDFADPYLAESNLSLRGVSRGIIRYLRGSSSDLYLNYKNAFIDILKRSNVVLCSSLEQKKILLPYNKNIKIILDSHIDECNSLKNNFKIGEIINIGWEGQHATLPSLLKLVRKIRTTYLGEKVHFHVLTDDAPKQIDRLLYGNSMKDFLIKKNFPITFYPWSISNLNKLTEICDFAVIPVNLKNPMHLLKPENRIHLFWRLGLPVIASLTDSNLRAMSLCKQDLCADTLDKWIFLIEKLISSSTILKTYSKKSHNYVVNHFDTNYFINLWKDAIESALGIMI